MDITVARGGKFTFTIDNKDLSKGLRRVKQNPRNSDSLITCSGAIGLNGSLQVMDSLTRMATTTITDGFPFPQIFVLTNMTIVCGLTKIYEWDGAALVLKYTTTSPGGTWALVDFYNYVYLSNGEIAVVRDIGGTYALSTTLPTTTTICNYNGQVLVGAPDIVTGGLGANMILPSSPITVTNTQLGTMTTG